MNFRARVVFGLLLLAAGQLGGQTPQSQAKLITPTVTGLEKSFFTLLRNGDAQQFLSYVPEDGVNLGRDAEHATKSDIEEQLTKRTGLYCKLFDTACLQATAEGHAPSCSYRELLNGSEKVRTASTEATRNNIRQAVLVAEVQNDKCGGHILIDFIFNQQQGGWKLFSIP
jgi:hypothetical protein